MKAAPEREVDRSVSQTVKAQLALRDQILSGALRPGERISELQAVETTGASRTPNTSFHAAYDDAAQSGSARMSPSPIVTSPKPSSTSEMAP